MKNILVINNFSEENRARIYDASKGANVRFISIPELDSEIVSEADAIIGALPIPLIASAKKLEYLQLCSAGADPYIAPGVLPESVTLCNATGAYGHAVSEHLLAGILAVIKKLHVYRDAQHQHSWASLGSVPAISDLTAVVIGPGDIGGRLAVMLKSLGMHIICIRRTEAEKPSFADEVYTVDNINDILPKADIIAMAVPGAKSTYHMISDKQFDVMKKGVIIANAGRGNAIDPDALIRAVNSGTVKAAFLDVTEPEPLPSDHPLWDKESVFITPHISGGYNMQRTQDNLTEIIVSNISRYISGQPLANIVDRETGYRRV